MPLDYQAIVTKYAPLIHAQGPSFESGMCMYRGPDGVKCIVGMMIDDAHYLPSLEGETISARAIANRDGDVCPIVEALALSGVIVSTNEDTSFLYDLQQCHDDAAVVSYRTTGRLAAFQSEFVVAINKLCVRYSLISPFTGEAA